MQETDQRLSNAIAALDVAGVRGLLAAGVDVTRCNGMGDSVFIECVQSVTMHRSAYDPRAGEIMRHLIAAGAEANPCGGEAGCSVLHTAALLGQHELMAILLAAGADPNVLDEGETALDVAKFDHWYEQLEAGCEGRIFQRSDFTLAEADDKENGRLHLIWRHQQGIPLLRRHGARARWELEPKPISEYLRINADWHGGLATSNGCVDDSELAALSADTREQLRRWLDGYVNPWVDGFDAATVAAFDYDAHATAGLAIARRVVDEMALHVPVHFIALRRATLDARSHRPTIMTWTPVDPQFRENHDD